MRLTLTALLAASALAGLPDAAAQVRRCETADGAVVFTDRRCADLGAVERAAPARPAVAARIRGGCARSFDDLVFELGSAINSQDANRLASLYHWTGMGTQRAYATMGRLDAIARRPLVDIVPVMPAGPGGIDGNLYPQTTVRRAPVALRIEQTLANGITPSRSVFGLQRHLGCWWIRG